MSSERRVTPKGYEYIGHRFGPWTVLKEVTPTGGGTKYLCQCECGALEEKAQTVIKGFCRSYRCLHPVGAKKIQRNVRGPHKFNGGPREDRKRKDEGVGARYVKSQYERFRAMRKKKEND